MQGDKTSGYMNGSDSWEKLVGDCEDLNTATPESIDTVAELCTIYQNKTIVEASLSKAGGSKFNKYKYWSCCQSSNLGSGAQILNFSTGNAVNYDKESSGLYVCSVRAF